MHTYILIFYTPRKIFSSFYYRNAQKLSFRLLSSKILDLAEVVDVTAVRKYKVPGTLDHCDVVDFVLEIW